MKKSNVMIKRVMEVGRDSCNLTVITKAFLMSEIQRTMKGPFEKSITRRETASAKALK